MDWNENEEQINDRCSTASSLSNSGEVGSVQLTHKKSAKNQTSNHSSQFNGNTSVNLDSMSDGELSDFSLNDSDDDEFRVTTANGMNLLNDSVSKNVMIS